MQKSTKIVTTMAMGTFLCMLDTTVMNIALPAIQTGLATNLAQLSWALNIYTILFASLTIPLGRLADIYGRARLYLIGLALFLGGSLFSGLAGHVSWLIVGRGVQSLGAAIVFPASMTIGIQSVPAAKRTGAIAILGTTQGLAAALGPTIGGAVTQFFGWRGIFLINVPLVLIMLGLCWWLLDRQTTETVTEKIDWVGSLCSMGTLFSLTLMLVKGSDWGWTSSVVIRLGVFSLVALVSFIVVEAHVEQPMMPLALFHNRQFTGAALITIISGVFMVALLVLLPSFFTKVQGKTELVAALMISPASMMIFLFSPISGFVLAKVGPRAVILSGILAIIAGYVGLSRLNPDHYWQLLIVLLLVGAGYGIIIGPITVLAAGDFTGKLLTASQSVIGVFRQIGTSLAVAIFVSALSTNLVTAKHQVWQTAQGAVANLTVSAKAKQDTLAAVRAQLATEKVASGTSKHFITPAKTQHLIRQNYAQVIKQQRLALAPVQVRRAFYRRVQRTVIATVVHDNQQIATVVTKVKATSKTALTGAFMRPYQVAMPVTFSTLPLLISFKRRRDYLKQ
ncbi:MFS transporter [Levilactobacillus angrenensis]|uniref:MFS transporter n=1 Tax=Levilactobacillus angrenensis TaxID=2486020 RepID=A0ABW1UEC0_9LACO|nr:MFS transporter [Levilactobacillus angrenensis]